MLTKEDMVTLEGSYGREALINVVRTTKYYLRRALSSEGLQYRGYPVRIELSGWGKRTVNGTYHVCIASLWYLMETGHLLNGGPTLLARFLDSILTPLRWGSLGGHTIG